MKNLYLKISIVVSSILFLVFLGLLIDLVAKPLVYNEKYTCENQSNYEIFYVETLKFYDGGIFESEYTFSSVKYLYSYYIEHEEIKAREIPSYSSDIGDSFIAQRENLFKISITNQRGKAIYTCHSGIIAVSIYSIIATLGLAGVITLSIILKRKSKV